MTALHHDRSKQPCCALGSWSSLGVLNSSRTSSMGTGRGTALCVALHFAISEGRSSPTDFAAAVTTALVVPLGLAQPGSASSEDSFFFSLSVSLFLSASAVLSMRYGVSYVSHKWRITTIIHGDGDVIGVYFFSAQRSALGTWLSFSFNVFIFVVSCLFFLTCPVVTGLLMCVYVLFLLVMFAATYLGKHRKIDRPMLR